MAEPHAGRRPQPLLVAAAAHAAVTAGKESPVVIDPEFNFGAPTVDGISTEVLAEMVDAGEPLEEVADDYGLSPARLRQALAYEWAAA